MSYQKLVKKCQEEIEKEFKDLTEDLTSDWGRMHSIDAGYCDSKNKCGGKGRDMPWRGFESTKVQDKCLPYDCEASCQGMLEVCHMLGTDPVIQGAMSKLIAYVVGPTGHEYHVKLRPGEQSSVRKDRRKKQIESGISYTLENASCGTKKGWPRVQRETFRRMIKGEYFRHWKIDGGELKIRFREPFDVQHPPRWADVQNPPPSVTEEAMEARPTGKFGLHTKPDDSCDVLGYFERVGKRDGYEDHQIYYYWRSNQVQHGKMLGDSNDERGVGLFYYSYMYIKMARKIMDALFRISQIQAKYAAIWTFAETARVGKIRQVGEQVAADDAKPEEIEPGEHMAKGFSIDLPGTKIRTNQWTAIIGQLLEFAGASADMPIWMMSSRSEGGRSNNVASEGPFDLSIQTHQNNLSSDDIDLIWQGVAAFNKWTAATLRAVRRDFVIESRPCTTATRDFHRFVGALVQLMQAGVMSPEEIAQRTGADYDLTKEWLKSVQNQTHSLLSTGTSTGTGGPAPGGN